MLGWRGACPYLVRMNLVTHSRPERRSRRRAARASSCCGRGATSGDRRLCLRNPGCPAGGRADTFAANEASQLLEGATDAANAAADARPVYPYSIISGGAHSVAELKAAIDADPVVRTHFASFDLSRTRVETLDTPRVAHVSYRVGNNVYWTRKTVILSTGEKVLTDGQHVARTRCGNQVADVPGIVGPDEPAPDLLDTALARGPLTGLSTPLAAPGATSGVGPLSSVGSSGSGPAPGPSGSFPGGGVVGPGAMGAPGGAGPSATPTTNPSLQPSEGDNPTTGGHEDPAPTASSDPGGTNRGGPGGPGGPGLPSNPLAPPDALTTFQNPPGGRPATTARRPAITPGDAAARWSAAPRRPTLDSARPAGNGPGAVDDDAVGRQRGWRG